MKRETEGLFPIMALGYRHDEDIRELLAAGVDVIAIGIPWEMIRPHEMQARSNHGGQTLDRLAARGGLSACEALAVLDDRRWERMPKAEAVKQLAARVAQFAAGRQALADREGPEHG